MAVNIVTRTAYQINQHVIPLTATALVGLPTQGCVLGDCITSPQRALSTGISVYSFAVAPDGNKYYFQDTLATLASAFNA